MAQDKNPFERGGAYGDYAKKIYELLKKKEWMSNESIHKATYPDDEDKPKKPIPKQGISHMACYGELKKAVRDIRNLVEAKCPDTIESEGSKKKRFRYVGDDNDPLEDLLNAVTIKDLKVYAEFCQDSAGFIPVEWLKHFFKNTYDWLNIRDTKDRGEQIVVADVNRGLHNIELLPLFYDAIKEKKVVRFQYHHFLFSEPIQVTMHPHFLKEYNGRWHIFGKTSDLDNKLDNELDIAHAALDRIEKHNDKWIEPIPNIVYESAPPGYYIKRFEHVVGLTSFPDQLPCCVHVRTKNKIMYGLTRTKPLHHTQKEIIPFNGEFAEFTLNVELNNEFFSRILQMGEGLEITEPKEARHLIKSKVEELSKIYSV